MEISPKPTAQLVRFIRRLFMGIGAVIFVAASVWCIRTGLFLHRAVQVEGSIVRIEKSPSGEGRTVDYLIFDFRANDGRRYEQRTPYGSNEFKDYAVGQKVTVVFDPADPNTANIRSFKTMWAAPLFLLAFGGFMPASAWIITEKWNKDLKGTIS